MRQLLVTTLLLVPSVALAAPTSKMPAAWEATGYQVAFGLGVVAAILIGAGILMGMVRKLLLLAKVAIALGILTITVAVGSAAALIWFF